MRQRGVPHSSWAVGDIVRVWWVGGVSRSLPPPESCCGATGPISRAISPEATSRTYGLQSRDTKCTNAHTIGPEGSSEATGQTFHSRC